jgi:hypothetical protein
MIKKTVNSMKEKKNYDFSEVKRSEGEDFEVIKSCSEQKKKSVVTNGQYH